MIREQIAFTAIPAVFMVAVVVVVRWRGRRHLRGGAV